MKDALKEDFNSEVQKLQLHKAKQREDNKREKHRAHLMAKEKQLREEYKALRDKHEQEN